MNVRAATITGRWMMTAPGSGQQLQHYIPPTASTSPYLDSYAFVAPCRNHQLCLPASPQYLEGMPVCPACVNLAPTAMRPPPEPRRSRR